MLVSGGGGDGYIYPNEVSHFLGEGSFDIGLARFKDKFNHTIDFLTGKVVRLAQEEVSLIDDEASSIHLKSPIRQIGQNSVSRQVDYLQQDPNLAHDYFFNKHIDDKNFFNAIHREMQDAIDVLIGSDMASIDAKNAADFDATFGRRSDLLNKFIHGNINQNCAPQWEVSENYAPNYYTGIYFDMASDCQTDSEDSEICNFSVMQAITTWAILVEWDNGLEDYAHCMMDEGE